MSVIVTGTVLSGLAIMGCSDDGPVLTASPPATLAPATDLAPSQISASTVPAPKEPPPCEVGGLRFSAPADGLIRIHNAGSFECEVDVSESRNRDPAMEPNVWLHPGGDAELLVEGAGATCQQPVDVDSIDLIVNGEPVTAPAMVPGACGVALVAIYTAD